MAENKKTTKKKVQTLRQQSKARFINRPQDTILFEKEPASLLHELQVHQIELEIQNEELRASQILIEESRRSFVELYEFAPVGYCTLDAAGVIRHVNLTLATLFTYSRRYILGKPLSLFVHHEDKDIVFKFLRRLGQIAGQQRCEMRMKKKGGEIFFAELISVPLETHDSTVTQYLVAVLEISARKKAEDESRVQRESIERNNEFLGSVLNGINDAFLAVDTCGRLSYLNHNTEILFGRNREEVLGKHFRTAYPECKDIELSKEQIMTLQAGKPLTFEYFYQGNPFQNWYEIRLYPFSKGMSVFISVITERKRIQESLEEHAQQLNLVNKELESFSYSVSHDLRNPLQIITSMVGVLRHSGIETLGEDGEECIGYIENSVERMSQLIADLLEFSQVARQDITVSKFDLSAMARSSIKELQQKQPERDVELVIQDNISMIADRRLMYIVMDNLIGNAWKYTSKKQRARIEIGVLNRNDTVVYFVKDNGVGFAPAQVEKLFVPFQRLHSQSQFPGTGIGLSIVARIISRHKGRIWAEGEKNIGATFYFVLNNDAYTNEKV